MNTLVKVKKTDKKRYAKPHTTIYGTKQLGEGAVPNRFGNRFSDIRVVERGVSVYLDTGSWILAADATGGTHTESSIHTAHSKIVTDRSDSRKGKDLGPHSIQTRFFSRKKIAYRNGPVTPTEMDQLFKLRKWPIAKLEKYLMRTKSEIRRMLKELGYAKSRQTLLT